ncbi:putative F-box protein [Tanacetum coccineum]
MDEERWITMLHRGPIKFEDLKGYCPFTGVHSELEARLESCYTAGSDICGESLDCKFQDVSDTALQFRGIQPQTRRDMCLPYWRTMSGGVTVEENCRMISTPHIVDLDKGHERRLGVGEEVQTLSCIGVALFTIPTFRACGHRVLLWREEFEVLVVELFVDLFVGLFVEEKHNIRDDCKGTPGKTTNGVIRGASLCDGKVQIMADFLCEELIDEILGKLPPKSLLRFRTLSKSWLHPEDEYMWKESAKFPVSNCHIVGSCNGIICLYKNIGSSFTLWNPSIRRKLTIPSHPSGDFTLAYGFGFDPLADDYKIVSISFEGVQTSFLYSMKANVWSHIGPPSTSFYTVKSFACFVNGILHWVVKSESSDTGHSYILTFDLSTHVFGMISLPKPNWITNEIKRLSSCDFE